MCRCARALSCCSVNMSVSMMSTADALLIVMMAAMRASSLHRSPHMGSIRNAALSGTSDRGVAGAAPAILGRDFGQQRTREPAIWAILVERRALVSYRPLATSF